MNKRCLVCHKCKDILGKTTICDDCRTEEYLRNIKKKRNWSEVQFDAAKIIGTENTAHFNSYGEYKEGLDTKEFIKNMPLEEKKEFNEMFSGNEAVDNSPNSPIDKQP